MEKKLECKWLGLSLKSPFILSSLTLVSNVSLKAHLEYFSYFCDCGAGAIILPSINPKVQGNPEQNSTIADCVTFDTGIEPKSKMGFSVLGPTLPNIISVNYGISLAKEAKKLLKAPVIGSIANLGDSSDELIDVAKKLCNVNVDAIELNFSCPNIRTEGNGIKMIANIIREIRQICDIPISLKLAPQYDFLSDIGNFIGIIDGVTLSNAYIGLIPPIIDKEIQSPFLRRNEWAPSGVYGPFEKHLTFYDIYRYKIAMKKDLLDLNLACVGGVVSGTDAIQAILLGADVVELSSAILWNGGSAFKTFNESLLQYLEKNKLSNIDEIKGKALENIRDSADKLTLPSRRYMIVNENKCKCERCSCVHRLCLAFSKEKAKHARIDKNLCSGCGMCVELCRMKAIEIIEA